MIRKITLTLCLTILSYSIYACDCKSKKSIDEARLTEMTSSDIVFIGEITKISDDKKLLTIVVEEIFKGDLVKEQELIFNNNLYCDPYVDKPGRWLIYASKIEGQLMINICGLSRSFKNPEDNRYFWIKPPSPARPVLNNDTSFIDENASLKIEQ